MITGGREVDIPLWYWVDKIYMYPNILNISSDNIEMYILVSQGFILRE